MRKSLTQADSGGQCTLGAGGRAGPLPTGGQVLQGPGSEVPPGGAGLGVAVNTELPAEAPAWGGPVFPDRSSRVPGLRMQTGSPRPTSSSFSPNKGCA